MAKGKYLHCKATTASIKQVEILIIGDTLLSIFGLNLLLNKHLFIKNPVMEGIYLTLIEHI